MYAVIGDLIDYELPLRRPVFFCVCCVMVGALHF